MRINSVHDINVQISPQLLLVRAIKQQLLALNAAVLVYHPLLKQALAVHHEEVVSRAAVVHEVRSVLANTEVLVVASVRVLLLLRRLLLGLWGIAALLLLVLVLVLLPPLPRRCSPRRRRCHALVPACLAARVEQHEVCALVRAAELIQEHGVPCLIDDRHVPADCWLVASA